MRAEKRSPFALLPTAQFFLESANPGLVGYPGSLRIGGSGFRVVSAGFRVGGERFRILTGGAFGVYGALRIPKGPVSLRNHPVPLGKSVCQLPHVEPVFPGRRS